MAGFMGLGEISRRVQLHPSACRTSAGLSALDLATAISDEWQSWRFGCEAECCGLTWTSATIATILGLGPHYRNTELRGGASARAGSDIAMPGHYQHFHLVYSDRNTRPYSITSDGSVCSTPSLLTPSSSDQTEVVSPPMTFANGDFEDWSGVLLMLRGLGGITGDGEGGHVHIDAAPIFDGVDAKVQAHRIGVYLAEFARWEPLIQAAIAMHPARRHWAEPVASRIRECLPGLSTTGLPGLERCWRPQGNFRQYDPRYRAVNLMNSRNIQGDSTLKNTIELRMPNGTLEPERWLAYVQLALALGTLAKTAKRATKGASVTVDPNTARYDFRVWLLALGLSGPQFKIMRDRLVSNLPGDAAWKPPKKVQPGAGITGATDPRALLRARRDPALWAAHPDGSFWVTSGEGGAATVQKTTEGRYLPIALLTPRNAEIAVFPIEGQPLARMAVGRTLQADSAALVRGPSSISREVASWRKGYPTLAAAQAAVLAAGPVGGSRAVASSASTSMPSASAPWPDIPAGGRTSGPAASAASAPGFAPSPEAWGPLPAGSALMVGPYTVNTTAELELMRSMGTPPRTLWVELRGSGAVVGQTNVDYTANLHEEGLRALTDRMTALGEGRVSLLSALELRTVNGSSIPAILDALAELQVSARRTQQSFRVWTQPSTFGTAAAPADRAAPPPAVRAARTRAVAVPSLRALQEAVARSPIPSSLFSGENMRITAPWGANDLASRILTTAAGRGEALRLTYETRAQASYAAGLLSSGIRSTEAISAVPLREVDVVTLSSGRALVEHQRMRHTHLRHYLKAILNAPGLVDVEIIPRMERAPGVGTTAAEALSNGVVVLHRPYTVGSDADRHIRGALFGGDRRQRKIVASFSGDANAAEQAATAVRRLWEARLSALLPSPAPVGPRGAITNNQTWIAVVPLPLAAGADTAPYLHGLALGVDMAGRLGLSPTFYLTLM